MSNLTREDVRSALADYAQAHGNIAAQNILKGLGSTLSDLPESKFAAALAATKKPPAANARANATSKPESISAFSDLYWSRRKTAVKKGARDGR